MSGNSRHQTINMELDYSGKTRKKIIIRKGRNGRWFRVLGDAFLVEKGNLSWTLKGG